MSQRSHREETEEKSSQKSQVEPKMDETEILARAIINNLVRYDQVYHAYLSYYLLQSGEGSVKILTNILEHLLTDFTLRPGSEAERYVSNAELHYE